MKKTFALTSPKISAECQVNDVKHQIRKYVARERRKTLPEGIDYWDFDCKIGSTPGDAQITTVLEIIKKIDAHVQAQDSTIYVEILAKPAKRNKKEAPQQN